MKGTGRQEFAILAYGHFLTWSSPFLPGVIFLCAVFASSSLSQGKQQLSRSEDVKTFQIELVL
jgi:hypothetical protein